MKYLVPVQLIDRRDGKFVTVPFFADTPERALLLHDLLMTAQQDAGGAIHSFSGASQHHWQLCKALLPCQVDA